MKNENRVEGTLLIVEDEIELAEIIGEVATEFVSEVFVANNGKEALDLIKSVRIDAVLSDVQMPIMTGFELLRQTRAAGFTIPFAFLSAHSDPANLMIALKLGAVDFVAKPGSNKMIKDAVKRILDIGISARDLHLEILKSVKDLGATPAQIEHIAGLTYATQLLSAKNEAAVRALAEAKPVGLSTSPSSHLSMVAKAK